MKNEEYKMPNVQGVQETKGCCPIYWKVFQRLEIWVAHLKIEDNIDQMYLGDTKQLHSICQKYCYYAENSEHGGAI